MASTAHHRHDLARGRYLHWLALAPMAAFGLATMASPSDDGPTLCPVALLTGMACPGCGMSRALAWLVRGDLETSLAYHPLAPLILMVGLVAVVWALGRRYGGWKAPRTAWINSGLVGLAVLLMAVWVTRFMTGTLPPV